MDPNMIYPYYYPTTVIFVDDNSDFLTNFSLQLDSQLAYRLFDSPRIALQYLNREQQNTPLYQRCFSHDKSVANWAAAGHLIHLDLTLIEREISNPQRFGEISVAMVDYDMPSLNGLAFCREIKNPRIKKILFTGVGDETIAVKAFNEGIIDRFILKNAPNVQEVINKTLVELQRAYFRDMANMLKSTRALEALGFRYDAAFTHFFYQFCREHHIVEYYLTVKPSGFLLVTAQGDIYRMLVQTQAELDIAWNVAKDNEAPEELLEVLARGRCIPFFPGTSGGYYDKTVQNWKDYLYPSQVIHGEEPYYYAVLDYQYSEPQGKAPYCYEAYLEWLDTVGTGSNLA